MQARVCVVVVALAAGLVAGACSEAGQDGVRCRTRPDNAAVTVSGAASHVEAINDLLGRLGVDVPGVTSNNTQGSGPNRQAVETQRMVADMVDSFTQMASVRQLMRQTQGEVERISQEMLPNTQRSVMHAAALTAAARDSSQALTAKLQAMMAEPPPSQWVADHSQRSKTIATLHAIRNSLTREPPAQPEEGESQEDLMQQYAALVNTELKDESLLVQHSLHSSSSSGTVGARRDRVVGLVNQVLESMEQTQDTQEDTAASTREAWSSGVETQQQAVDRSMGRRGWHQTNSYQYLAHSHRLRVYLKRITAQQYALKRWFQLVESDLQAFGRHVDTAVRLKGSTIPLFRLVKHMLEAGDAPANDQSQSDGSCDNMGGQEDACGVCRGLNLTCQACDGAVGGSAVLDVCGVCGPADKAGSDCSYFCDATPNSGRVEDLCGVCDGNDRSCMGCDSMPHSPLTYDTCGVCGGSGESCADTKGCVSGGCPPITSAACGPDAAVTSTGFAGCCFSPATDCVNITTTL